MINGLIEEGEAFARLGSAPSRSARRFHVGMSIALLLTAFAGFAPSYYLRSLSDRPPLGALLHVHGLVFTSWLVLLFTQSALVSARRVDLHRRLGIAGALIAATMVPLGFMAALEAGRSWLVTGKQPLGFVIFPLGQILMFAVFVGAALWKRRTKEVHRRLILLASITTITAALARIVVHPLLALALSALFIVAGMVHDWRTQRRVHPVYIWGGLVFVLSGPLRFAIARTAACEHLACWLVA
jgi:hypothetical protein